MCSGPGLRNCVFHKVSLSFAPNVSSVPALLALTPSSSILGELCPSSCAAFPRAAAPRGTAAGCSGPGGPAQGLPLPLPKTSSLFCAFIPYSCDHLRAMLSLSFPDSAGISGSFPSPSAAAEGSWAALCPSPSICRSLPPSSPSLPPTPCKSPLESAVTWFYFLLAPVARSHLTCLRYSSVAGGKRGQLLPGVSLAA